MFFMNFAFLSDFFVILQRTKYLLMMPSTFSLVTNDIDFKVTPM